MSRKRSETREDREDAILESKRKRLLGAPQPGPRGRWAAPVAVVLSVLAVAVLALLGRGEAPRQVVLPEDAPLPGSAARAAAAAAPSASAPSERPFVYEQRPVDYAGKSVLLGDVAAKDVGEYVELPLEDVLGKKLVRFDHQGARKVPMLAYVAPSGRIVTAVRACEPCKNYDKFSIEGDILVCGKCGTRWTLEDLKGISGGCMAYPPDELPNIIRGRSILVRKSDMDAWKERA